ncbi:MAG TPA: site-specific integrase [Chitinophagaceae bacterium]|nr:site-specific integrase [Chitinophagaceae bacterium]
MKTLETAVIEEPGLAFIRDLFVFSCYTGFAFADVIKFTRSDFETDDLGTIWCRIYRTKSDILAPVPLLPQTVQLVTRYRRDARTQKRETIFPPITNQQVNRGLKTLRDECGIDTPVTFHVARHTFAKTVALRNGVPLETMQMMLGHTKISTTQLYAEVDEEKILRDMSVLQEKSSARAGLQIPG